MGGSTWSDDHYQQAVTTRVAAKGTAFAYDADVRGGRASGVNAKLDPKLMTNGIRESRDSDAHPNSNAIMVWLDVTGSMGVVSRQIHAKLPTLMGLLTRKGYIDDPQILFGAVGDAYSDSVPIQVGQFESGAEMEGDLAHFYIEGGGGGQVKESYELAAFVGARCTSIDCLEKRGKQGYCFIIGDEHPYPEVSASQVRSYLGKGAEQNIPTEAIFRELQQKYVVFFVIPAAASYGQSQSLYDAWAAILGAEHVLRLTDTEAIAELIATQIGLCEGSVDLSGAVRDLHDHGTSSALVRVVEGAVSSAYKGAVAKTHAFPTSGGSRIERMA